MSNDQTGFGYASAGWAPLETQRQDARRNKYHTERMGDAMQNLDPYINQAVEAAMRTQVRNGSDPAEVRRAAFGSASGQLMRDTFGGMRHTGFMGQGSHINYGANIMQGVAGGGFSMNMLSPQGRMNGMNQQVTGNGALAEKVAIQMAKDVMGNLYGKGTPDPSKLYGFNMEESSGIFNTLAQRGALGNVGAFKRYKPGEGIAEKIAQAKRQETDHEVLAGLEGVTEGNIDERIAKAAKEGNTRVVASLGSIKTAETGVVLDDNNTKRITDIQKDVLKGLANLKDIYGELNSPQLLAQMEALSGIRITNGAEARKASHMTAQMRNAAEAAGFDPRTVMDMATSEGAVLAGQQRWAQNLGLDNRDDGVMNQARAAFDGAARNQTLLMAGNLKNVVTRVNGAGGNVEHRTEGAMLADANQQIDKMAEQDPEMIYASGLARGQFANDAAFGVAHRETEEEYAAATNREERRAAGYKMRQLMQSKGITFSKEWMSSEQGKLAGAGANAPRLVNMAVAQGNGAVDLSAARAELAKLGSAEDAKLTEQALKSGIGLSGMADIKAAHGAEGGGADEIAALLASFTKNGSLSEERAGAMKRTMLGSDGRIKDIKAWDNFSNDLGRSNARGTSHHERSTVRQGMMDVTALDQRTALSNGKELSLKSIINSLATGKTKGGLGTETQQMALLEALHSEGMGGGMAGVSTTNTTDGFSQEEMDTIRKNSGDANFELHTKLGYKSEADLLEASGSDSEVRQAMITEMQTGGKLMVGGTADALKTTSLGVTEKLAEKKKNAELAATLRGFSGVKTGEMTDAMTQLMETGKVAAGTELPGTDAEGATAYDPDAAKHSKEALGSGPLDYVWGSITGADAKHKNTIHMSQAGGFAQLATDTLGDGFDRVRALNEATGGGTVTQMERQLAVLKTAQKDPEITTMDTYDANGKSTKIDLAKTSKDLEAAIKKLSQSGSGAITEHMTVTHMTVIKKEEK